MRKCQKDPTHSIFLKWGLFKDIKNYIPVCRTHKYKNTNTQIYKYSIWGSARKTQHVAYFWKEDCSRVSKIIFTYNTNLKIWVSHSCTRSSFRNNFTNGQGGTKVARAIPRCQWNFSAFQPLSCSPVLFLGKSCHAVNFWSIAELRQPMGHRGRRQLCWSLLQTLYYRLCRK